MRLRLLASLVASAAMLSACQDPSGVGLDLIDEEGTDPNVVVVAADSVGAETEDDVTGGFATSSPVQARVLVGAAMDPLVGDVQADAYFDFIPSTTVPEDFFDDPIVGAELRLVRDYVYGDSTAMLPLELYEIEATWTPVDANADTTFAVAGLLDTYTRTASDTLMTLALPSSWIDAYDEILRSDSVISAIEGFQLRVPEGAMPNVVVGFNGPQSRLRLRTAQDTVDFPIAEVFSHLERGDAPEAPAGLRFLRDGSGEVLRLTFPLDTLGTPALANATLRLDVDAEALDTHDGFHRPLPAQLSLFVRGTGGARAFIATATLDDDTNRYTFTSGGLTALLQQDILGDSNIAHFELAFPASPGTVDAIPLRVGPEPAPGDPDRRPRFSLTLVPVPN